MNTVWKSLLASVIFILLFLFLFNLVFLAASNAPWNELPKDKFLQSKIDFYKEHRNQLNLIFVGDSQTYQCIDPQAIDEYLNTRSYNLAVGAHWFPTQYPMLYDLLPVVPKDTTVVWSIAGHNFLKCYSGPIYQTYPIPPAVLLNYFKFGFSFIDVFDNFFYFNFYQKYCDFIPGLSVQARAGVLFAKWKAFCDRPVGTAQPKPERVYKNANKFKMIKNYFRRAPRVLQVNPCYTDNNISMATLDKVQGNVIMVELDAEHFKAKREKIRADMIRSIKHAELLPLCKQEYWNMFLAMLDLFQKNHIRLIVNEFDRAPYCYVSQTQHTSARQFMKKVRQEVERRNILFISYEESLFKDEDYFDTNHLNIQGVRKYCFFLAQKLRPYVGPKRI